MMTSTYSISFRGRVRGVCMGLTLTTLAATALAQIPPPTGAPGNPPTFADPVLFPSPKLIARGATGDLDGDGHVDVAAVGAGCASPCTAQVVIFLSDPTKWDASPLQGFSETIVIPVDSGGNVCNANCLGADIIVAPLDGDTLDDIAIVTTRQSDERGVLFILLNDPANAGHVFFESHILLPAGYRADGLTNALLNKTTDAFMDLAVASENACDPDPNCIQTGTAAVITYFGDGQGGFNLHENLTLLGVSGSAWDVVAGTFDIDLFKPDLVTCNISDNSISRLLNDGSGNFSTINKIDGPSADAFKFFGIGKGRLDVSSSMGEIACSEDTPPKIGTVFDAWGENAFRHNSAGDLIHVRPGGKGTGDHYQSGLSDYRGRGTQIGRINPGGTRDVATVVMSQEFSYGDVLVQLGLGDGNLERDGTGNAVFHVFGLEPSGATKVRTPEDVVLVDLNEDGLNDLVVVARGDPSDGNAPALLSVLINTTN